MSFSHVGYFNPVNTFPRVARSLKQNKSDGYSKLDQNSRSNCNMSYHQANTIWKGVISKQATVTSDNGK